MGTRPPAGDVERRLWDRHLLRVGEDGDLSDPENTRRIGRSYKTYLQELTRAGVVNTPSGWHYKDEVEPYGPVKSGLIVLKSVSKKKGE